MMLRQQWHDIGVLRQNVVSVSPMGANCGMTAKPGHNRCRYTRPCTSGPLPQGGSPGLLQGNVTTSQLLVFSLQGDACQQTFELCHNIESEAISGLNHEEYEKEQ
jgi:hypothetical protein